MSCESQRAEREMTIMKCRALARQTTGESTESRIWKFVAETPGRLSWRSLFLRHAILGVGLV
jgi:hypothetical protein